MRVRFSTRAACVLAVATILSMTNAEAALDNATRLIAIRAAIGLGCAVQDRDAVRANAWVQMMMSRTATLAVADLQEAQEFAAFVSGTAVEGMRRGGYECEAIPKMP
jgi:hypothetical protein